MNLVVFYKDDIYYGILFINIFDDNRTVLRQVVVSVKGSVLAEQAQAPYQAPEG
jgi:hypothetical protein